MIDQPLRDYTNSQNQAMEDLLACFDGDSTKALQAIKQYSRYIKSQQSNKNTKASQYSDAPVLLSIKDLSKTYKLGKQQINALESVSVDIREGEIVAITGSSGSGKSTLLQLMGGLDKPTSGEIIVDGKNIAKLSDKDLSNFRLKTIGFVFQFFYLQPFLKLKQNLEVPGMFSRAKAKDRHAVSQELADKVGLGDRLNHLPKELSGGQMQRSAIARALFNSPKILLADEPTGNLDSANGQTIIDLFEKIRQELGTTIVIVTHDKEVARRADRVIELSDGKVV